MEFINRVQGWNQDEFEQFLRELETILIGLPVRGNTSPVVTAASGTLTSVSADVRFTRSLDRCAYDVAVTITTNGTGSGHIVVPMPFAAAATTASSGVDSAGTTSALTGFISGSNLIIKKYEGSYPGADGLVLRMSGNYRISR